MKLITLGYNKFLFLLVSLSFFNASSNISYAKNLIEADLSLDSNIVTRPAFDGVKPQITIQQIPNQHNLSEKYSFNPNSKVNLSDIANQGLIKAPAVGDTLSIVNNSGSVVVNLDKVVFPSGEKNTVELDKNISFVISEANENSAFIQANSRAIEITKNVLNNILDHATNNSEIVQANSLVNQNGIIALTSTSTSSVATGLPTTPAPVEPITVVTGTPTAPVPVESITVVTGISTTPVTPIIAEEPTIVVTSTASPVTPIIFEEPETPQIPGGPQRPVVPTIASLTLQFVYPLINQLSTSQVNTFDLISSSTQAGSVFLYHPLSELDSSSYADGIALDEAAYDFIDGKIEKKSEKM